MENILIVIAALSWIACSVLVGRCAGKYYESPVAAWVYMGVSLVLSPLVGGVALVCSVAVNTVEDMGSRF